MNVFSNLFGEEKWTAPEIREGFVPAHFSFLKASFVDYAHSARQKHTSISYRLEHGRALINEMCYWDMSLKVVPMSRRPVDNTLLCVCPEGACVCVCVCVCELGPVPLNYSQL